MKAAEIASEFSVRVGLVGDGDSAGGGAVVSVVVWLGG